MYGAPYVSYILLYISNVNTMKKYSLKKNTKYNGYMNEKQEHIKLTFLKISIFGKLQIIFLPKGM